MHYTRGTLELLPHRCSAVLTERKDPNAWSTSGLTGGRFIALILQAYLEWCDWVLEMLDT